MSFRSKLLVATMLVVGGVTAAALLATQQNVGATYVAMFHERFEDEFRALRGLQEARLASVKSRLLELTAGSRSTRLLAVLEAEVPTGDGDDAFGRAGGDVSRHAPDTGRVYQTIKDELLDLVTPERVAVFRVIDRDGEVLAPPADRQGVIVSGDRGPWEAAVARVARELEANDPQRVGYLALEASGSAAGSNAGEHAAGLHEFVITKIVDRFTGRARGALAVGFPVTEFGEGGTASGDAVWSGIWHGGRLYSRNIPVSVRPALAGAVAAAAERGAGDSSFSIDAGGPHLAFVRTFGRSEFPPSYQVVLYSLRELHAQQRGLGRRILAYGGLALVLALGLGWVLANRLSVPIRELVAATEAIGAGELGAKVPVRSAAETGRLAAAFNDMVDGLALKERYRGVLDVIADKRIAQRLVDGHLALGGELRDVTVLFCDIRGFTTLTAELSPTETIALLNEHMTALTAVVHAHGGVVDKFVGDGLMAIFGAPHETDDHAMRAVRTAWGMLEARQRLNAGSGRTVMVGVGIASGSAVAGCVGAADRLNYTVVGGRVNLAARLCAHAPAGDILIDDVTAGRLSARVVTEPLAPVVLKGFSTPVPIYRVTAVAALATAS